jgi:sugar O-acyltransferase (sialic acid O-acetyltransferase NeuD family)
MRDLVLYGTGGLGREVLEMVLDINEERPTWNFLGFLDDDPSHRGGLVHDAEVLGGAAWLEGRSEVRVGIAIGSPAAKRRIAAAMADLGIELATIVHPRAWVGRRVEVGAGCILCPGSCASTDIRLGRAVLLNLNVTVGHDCELADYVTVNNASSVSGYVRMEEGVEMGTGARILPSVCVGAWSTIGAGAVATKNVPANSTVVGVPARVIKTRAPGWHR